MKITGRRIAPEENQGQIVLEVGGTTVATFSSTNVAYSISATDSTGVGRIVGITGGTYSVSSASAATAGSTSALSAVTITHSLGVLPTTFGTQPANARAALAGLLGTYITATSSALTLSVASTGLSATDYYQWQWWAAP